MVRSRSSNKSNKLKQESLNQSVDAVILEPESNNHTETKTESTVERMEMQQEICKTSRKKPTKKPSATVRRSQRLSNLVMTTESQDIGRLSEEVIVSDSEKEDEPLDGEMPEHVPPTEENAVGARLDYIIQLLEEQKENREEFPGAFGSSQADVTYKSLYIDSQKKIEALRAANLELNKNLQHALGKIEVYEKGNHLPTEMLEKLKYIFFCSSLTRATEAARNAMSDGNQSCGDIAAECRSCKRKKPNKEM